MVQFSEKVSGHLLEEDDAVTLDEFAGVQCMEWVVDGYGAGSATRLEEDSVDEVGPFFGAVVAF